MSSPEPEKLNPSDTRISLVSPEWVTSQTEASDIRVLDVRPDVYDYFKSHIPNAVHISEASFRAPLAGLPVQYLSPDHTAYLLARAGVSKSKKVLVYSDDENVLGATMVSYILAKLRQPEVMILNGGWNCYKSQAPTSQEFPTYTESAYPVEETQEHSVNLEKLRVLQKDGKTKFVDSRPEKAYRGETKSWLRNGHIPGAINVFWQSLTIKNHEHTFKPLDEIQEILSRKGLVKEDNIVIYCGTGREATIEYVILRHLLKFPFVKIYDGSWNEYSSYPDLPIVIGSDPYGTKAA